MYDVGLDHARGFILVRKEAEDSEKSEVVNDEEELRQICEILNRSANDPENYDFPDIDDELDLAGGTYTMCFDSPRASSTGTIEKQEDPRGPKGGEDGSDNPPNEGGGEGLDDGEPEPSPSAGGGAVATSEGLPEEKAGEAPESADGAPEATVGAEEKPAVDTGMQDDE